MTRRTQRILFANAAAAILTLVALVALTTWWGATSGSLPEPLPILGEVPDFALQERSGRTIELADLKGQVWVADFIFTHCAGPCPLLSQRMASLQNDLDDTPGVQLVSFSVDPERDTPEVLSEYAERYGAGDRWLFLTGDKTALYTLIMDGFKLGIDDGSAVTAGVPGPGTITHSVRFVLVDRRGRIRGYYDGNEPDLPDQLLPAVRTLLSE